MEGVVDGLETLTMEDLGRMQAADSEIAPVLEWMRSGQRPMRTEVAGQGQLVKSLWAMWDCLELRGSPVPQMGVPKWK